MPYKTGNWGEQAKERNRKRNSYFIEYRKNKAKEKTKARQKVHVAIKKGKLKPQACAFFGNDCHGRTEAHHPDYKHPLYVVWLCSKHHRREHSILKEIEQGKKQCLECGVEIKPPKSKYCSSRCNLKNWRKDKTQ